MHTRITYIQEEPTLRYLSSLCRTDDSVYNRELDSKIRSYSGYNTINIGDLNPESFDTYTDTSWSSNSLPYYSVPNNTERSGSSLTDTHLSESQIIGELPYKENKLNNLDNLESITDLYSTNNSVTIPKLTNLESLDNENIILSDRQPNSTGHVGRKRSPRLDKFKKTLSLRSLTPKKKKVQQFFSGIKENLSRLSPRISKDNQ